MNLCDSCSHDEFVVQIPNAIFNLVVLNEEEELSWTHQYIYPDEIGVSGDLTIKCKGCGDIQFLSPEEFGLQHTQEDMVSAYNFD